MKSGSGRDGSRAGTGRLDEGVCVSAAVGYWIVNELIKYRQPLLPLRTAVLAN